MRDLFDHPDYIELALPRFARMKVDLMAAPAAVGDVSYTDTSEVAAECDLVADAPFAETFMTAASPGIVCSAMENRYYRLDAPSIVAAVARRSADRIPLHRRPGGCSCRSTLRIWRWNVTSLFADRPLVGFPRMGGARRRMRSTGRSSASIRHG